MAVERQADADNMTDLQGQMSWIGSGIHSLGRARDGIEIPVNHA